MNYAHNLIPAEPPVWLEYQGAWHESRYLTAEQLASIDWLPLARDTEDAPLGYADPVLSEDGKSAVQHALGTPEERAAETLRQWRESAFVDAWQARYILAATPALTDGPLSAFQDTTLLNQIDAFVAANLSAPALEKFRGAHTWRRSDPMLIQLAGIANLDDVAIDEWFRAAEQVE
jgi:hypothetical protein